MSLCECMRRGLWGSEDRSGQSTKDIVARSRTLLTQCKKVIYFANGASLTGAGAAHPQKRQRTTVASAAKSSGGAAATFRDADCAAAAAGGAEAGTAEEGMVLDDTHLQTLASRLEFLNEVLPDGVEVMLQISRCPGGPMHANVSVGDAVAAALTGAHIEQEVGESDGAADAEKPAAGDGPAAAASFNGTMQGARQLPAFLMEVLQALGRRKQWKPGLVGPVYSSDHLDDEGNLDPEAICNTLGRMFKREMIFSQSDPSGFVVKHVLECFKQPLLRVDDADTFSIWLTRGIFQDYLEDLDGMTEVPDTVMLQRYDGVAQSLVARGLAIQHFSCNYSKIVITIVQKSSPSPSDAVEGTETVKTVLASPAPVAPAPEWGAVGSVAPVTSTTAAPAVVIVGGVAQPTPTAADRIRIRFPYQVQLLELLDAYFGRNVPSELWYGPSASKWLSNGHDEALRATLAAELALLETQLIAGLAAATPAGSGAKVGVGVTNTVEHVSSNPQQWLWALEDWAFGTMLLGDGADDDGAAADLVLGSSDAGDSSSGGGCAAGAQPLMGAAALATLLTTGEEGLVHVAGVPSSEQVDGATRITIVV